MRLFISTLLIFSFSFSFGRSTSNDSSNICRKKIDFEKQDAYFIIDDYEYIISEDAIDSLKLEGSRYDGTLLGIFNTRTDTFTIINPKSHCFIKRYLKLKINTKIGIDYWAYYILSSDITLRMQYLNIKILKTDGKVIDIDNDRFLNRAQIFKEQEKADSFKYSVPELEIGDIIEVAYFSDYALSNLMHFEGKIYVASNLVSLKTSHKYIFPSTYCISFNDYNFLKKPLVLNDTINKTKTIEFSADSVPLNTDTSAFNTIPYYTYLLKRGSIKKNTDTTKVTYLDIFNRFFSSANRNFSSLEPDIRWIKQNLEQYSISNKYLKFKFIYNLLYRNYENSNYIFGFDYNGSITKSQLLRFYVHLFNYLKINFYLALADSKFSGDIDLKTVKEEDLHFMFVFYDNDSNRYIVYPHSNDCKYYINEFPYTINGNKAVLLKQKNNSEIKKNIVNNGNLKDSTELEIKYISLNSGNKNTSLVQRTIKLDHNYKIAHYTSSHEYSGFYSTIRHSINEILKGKVPFNQLDGDTKFYRIDTIYNSVEETNYPFLYSLKSEGTINNILKTENDSIFTIDLNKIIFNNIMDFKTKNNINLAYAFSDTRDYTIEFPSEIKFLNSDSLSRQIDNDYGTFIFNSKPFENNKIHLVITYTIKKESIPKESFKYLSKINDAANSVLNSKLVIKINKLNRQ